MAGSATVTGIQHYTHGIGQPRVAAEPDQAPLTIQTVLRGPMVAATWMTIPSIFRLRITGTGTVTIDASDSLGNITLAVHVAVATAATDQIEFPYAGDDAVEIRATLGGTTTCEVI